MLSVAVMLLAQKRSPSAAVAVPAGGKQGLEERRAFRRTECPAPRSTRTTGDQGMLEAEADDVESSTFT